jgi:hypothetical protein
MEDKVNTIINKFLSQDKEILAGIFNEIKNKYPHETLRQHAVRSAVRQFELKYPDVMDEFDVNMKRRKELAVNEHAANYEQDYRVEFLIPDGLEARIKLVFDRMHQDTRFLSDEAERQFNEKLWFSREFPRFVCPAVF